MRTPARVYWPARATTYHGRTYNTIARRIWGRSAFVDLPATTDPMPGPYRKGVVMRPSRTNPWVFDAIAVVTCWMDEMEEET